LSALDRWTARAPMPTARDHHALGVVDARLYAIAGRINGNHDLSIGQNEEYDPRTDRWQSRAAIPTVRSGVVGAALKGKVLVFGREYNRGPRTRGESYDPGAHSLQ